MNAAKSRGNFRADSSCFVPSVSSRLDLLAGAGAGADLIRREFALRGGFAFAISDDSGCFACASLQGLPGVEGER